ncbi:MAG: hypothetical protein Q9191_001195 [Dirinaria sp. TL-2023a]
MAAENPLKANKVQALLRAIGDKIIPGIPHSINIALLQQTASSDAQTVARNFDSEALKESALEFIISNDTVKNRIQEELDRIFHRSPRLTSEVLSCSVASDEQCGEEWVRIRSYRRLQYTHMQRELAELEKNAALRSGARGSQARKELLAFEKQVAEAKRRIDIQDPPLASETCQNEVLQASELMTDLQAQLDERRMWDLERQARNVLVCLGFSEKTMSTPLGELSGGWQMRAMLANVLLQDVDIMILDEPTNFLDILGIIWLQEYLVRLRAESPKTVVVVSHDRDFIDHVCQEIILMKEKILIYFDGNLTAYEEDLKLRRINLTKQKEAQDKQIMHMEKTIASNIKAGKKSGDENKLRQAASRKKRIEDRSGMQKNEKGVKFKLSRDLVGWHDAKRSAIEIPPEERSNKLMIPLAAELRFPGPLISLEDVTFSYSPKQGPILRDINLTIHMGSRVGVVGLNGSGKSTLIKLVIGSLSPTKGSINLHSHLKLGYYSQLAVEELRAAGKSDQSLTALHMLRASAGDEMDEGEMRALLGSFHLPGHTASSTPVSKLSGGQLVRLALARIVCRHPHLLVLDEITTHLDFYTVIALGKALRAFNGALLLASHDRFLIKSIVDGDTELLAWDDDELESDEEEVAELQHSLLLLKKGKLTHLDRGMRDYEESLEKSLAKLSL